MGFALATRVDSISYKAALGAAAASEADVSNVSTKGLVVGNGELNAIRARGQQALQGCQLPVQMGGEWKAYSRGGEPSAMAARIVSTISGRGWRMLTVTAFVGSSRVANWLSSSSAGMK